MTEWIISSSVLILVIIALRKLLRGKVGLRLQYALWGIVLLRLVIPFSLFDSGMSVMNAMEKFSGIELAQTAEQISSPIGGVDELSYSQYVYDTNSADLDNPISYTGTITGYHSGDSDHNFPTLIASEATREEFEQLETAVKLHGVLITVWLTGAVVMLCFFVFSNLRFSGRLRRSRTEATVPGSLIPVYFSGAVETPCLFGLFRPGIYITPDCAASEQTMRHVLAHETTHYRHGDNFWSALRCLCLALHWYNPLVWWAAVLSKRDAELACDEGALRRLSENERTDYGRTLIGLSCTRGDFGSIALTATTMTGSKNSLKERVKLIANRPKTAFYTAIAVVLVAAVAVGCTFSGAASGFTDREAKKEAKPLAESVAHVNYYELDGNPEILRYEGGPSEADPEVNKQYVRVSYPTKNSLRKIVVEFCMTDGKGQHYDEPYSTTSYLSHSLTQIVPTSADEIERVQLWKEGYPNPVIPAAYFEEVKEYIPHFFHADALPTGTVPDTDAGRCGFNVFLKDGSSVTFGLDYVEQNGIYYGVLAPELPDWLTELLTAPGKLEMEYDELIRVNDDIKAKVEPSIIELAVDRVRLDVESYVRDWGVNIIDAELSAMEYITTGAADQYGNSIEMYRVEYRLLPEDPESVMLAGGMKMDGEWITEWGSTGQPYIMVYLEDGVYTGLSRNTTTESLELYSSEEMLKRFGGNKYTGAAMEFLFSIMGDYDYKYYVMLQTGGSGIPPYYHMKHAQTWTGNSWLYGDGKPLDLFNPDIPTVSIGDHPGFLVGYTELAIGINRFITRGNMQVYTESGELLRLYAQDAEDLYALDPGSYYVCFDIFVPGKYIAEAGENERTTYTCVFRLQVIPNEKGVFYFTGDTGSLVELYAREVYAKEMLSVEGDYAITDYKLVACDVYAERVDGDVVVGEMHYAITPVNPNLPDWWAGAGMEEGEGEYEGMWIRHNQFTLVSCGNGTWKCTGLATGGGGGWGFVDNRSPEEALAISLDLLESNSEDKTFLLKNLPLINFAEMDTEDFFDLMDAVEEVCVGEGIVYGPEDWRTWESVYPDDQFYRNMYCMKAALNTDGAYSARIQYVLNKLWHHDEELFARCLQYFSLEEQDTLIHLADDDLV